MCTVVLDASRIHRGVPDSFDPRNQTFDMHVIIARSLRKGKRSSPIRIILPTNAGNSSKPQTLFLWRCLARLIRLKSVADRSANICLSGLICNSARAMPIGLLRHARACIYSKSIPASLANSPPRQSSPRSEVPRSKVPWLGHLPSHR